jgi:hypothetical protein
VAAASPVAFLAAAAAGCRDMDQRYPYCMATRAG